MLVTTKRSVLLGHGEQPHSRHARKSQHTQRIQDDAPITINTLKTFKPPHHPRHVQGIQGTPQHIQGIHCIQGTHDFVVLNRQQNVHGVWATATFRQKSSRRVDHSNISPLQGPARRGQILRSGRRPDPVGVSINRTIISEGFSVPESPGAIRAVFGALRARPGTGRFREVRATEISIDPSGRASDVDTRRGTRRRTTTPRGHHF